MSQKRKAEDQIRFRNYLDKLSRVNGDENIDYDDEEELFQNGKHPVQTDPDKAFKNLDRLLQQRSFPKSVNLNTQSTAHSGEFREKSGT